MNLNRWNLHLLCYTLSYILSLWNNTTIPRKQPTLAIYVWLFSRWTDGRDFSEPVQVVSQIRLVRKDIQ
jgi:hypothetical protein